MSTTDDRRGNVYCPRSRMARVSAATCARSFFDIRASALPLLAVPAAAALWLFETRRSSAVLVKVLGVSAAVYEAHLGFRPSSNSAGTWALRVVARARTTSSTAGLSQPRSTNSRTPRSPGCLIKCSRTAVELRPSLTADNIAEGSPASAPAPRDTKNSSVLAAPLPLCFFFFLLIFLSPPLACTTTTPGSCRRYS